MGIVVRPAYQGPAPAGAAGRPPVVEDDDSDEEGVPAQDGTLLASGPPRPLYVVSKLLTCNCVQ